MAAEISMPIGMLFRKMYCAHCGNLLERKKVKKTYRRGEPGFRNTLTDRSTINVGSYTTIYYVYCCPGCKREISYEDQKAIAREQAKQNRRIIEDKKPENDSLP